MGRNVIVDTNVLIDGLDVSYFEHIYVPIVVIEELDNLKRNKDESLAHKASSAIKMLQKAKNVDILWDFSFALPAWLPYTNDNRIVGFAKDITTSKTDYVFLSNDYNVRLKCASLNIPCESYGFKGKNDKYDGWQELSLNTEQILEFRNDITNGINTYEFLCNEYLILHNTDTDEVTEERFDGVEFVRLKLPSSKVIKGLNSQQRCAMDLLLNRDIPIKCIVGKPGSGKTLLSTKIGLHLVEDEKYKTLMFLRNCLAADGTDIGFLPGSKQEKIEDYCRPLLQYINSGKNPFYAENLLREERIKMDTISFLKGVNIEDSFVIMDESEDLNTKLLKLVGTRIAKTSCIVFIGDYKQAESKYKKDNGLVKLVREMKGNPLVGIVNLPEDLRSDASKLFADLD